jgi:hypothetical protein
VVQGGDVQPNLQDDRPLRRCLFTSPLLGLLRPFSFFTWGRFFVHFFPRKITFREIFHGISWEGDFSKIPTSPDIVLGGKISAEKNVQKSA